MQAFDLDSSLVENHSSFLRSLSKVRAPGLKVAIDAQYAEDHFWPDALLSINPHFERGKRVLALQTPRLTPIRARPASTL